MLFYFYCPFCGRKTPHVIQFHKFEGVEHTCSQTKCTYCGSLPFNILYAPGEIAKGEKVPFDWKPGDIKPPPI